MRVESERILLRRLVESDITDQYVGYYNQPELTKFMYQTPRVTTAEKLRKELETGNETNQFHMYAIVDKAKDLVIGNIRVGYILQHHKISDLAVFVGNPSYLGKGFATEAVSLGNKLSFEHYDIRKLFSRMFHGNMASVKAYLKTGWVIEGILKAQYMVDGKPMDQVCVANFNPRYFSPEFLKSAKLESDEFFKNL